MNTIETIGKESLTALIGNMLHDNGIRIKSINKKDYTIDAYNNVYGDIKITVKDESVQTSYVADKNTYLPTGWEIHQDRYDTGNFFICLVAYIENLKG